MQGNIVYTSDLKTENKDWWGKGEQGVFKDLPY